MPIVDPYPYPPIAKLEPSDPTPDPWSDPRFGQPPVDRINLYNTQPKRRLFVPVPIFEENWPWNTEVAVYNYSLTPAPVEVESTWPWVTSGAVLATFSASLLPAVPTVDGLLSLVRELTGSLIGIRPTVDGDLIEVLSLSGSVTGVHPSVNGEFKETTLIPGGSLTIPRPSVNGSITAITDISGALETLRPTVDGDLISITNLNGSLIGLRPTVDGAFAAATLTNLSGSLIGLRPTIDGGFGVPPSQAEVVAWVNAVVAAGGSVSVATQNAMNTYVAGCKADGIWTKMSSGIILPFASDGFLGVFVPLVIPSGKTITNHNFVSGDYSLTSGLDPGGSNSSKRISTSTIVSDIFTSTSCQISVYQNLIRSHTNTTVYCGNGAGNQSLLLFKSFSGIDYFDSFDNVTARIQASTGSARGLTSGVRTASNATAIYVNGSATVTGTASGGTFPASGPISIFAFFNGSSHTVFDCSRCQYVYMGPGLTASEEAAHYSRVQALQTALGRQV